MSTSIYLHYDQAELDRQINLRAKWPDHQTYFDRWARESHAVLESRPVLRDFAYGSLPGERLDLFESQTAGTAQPLLLFIHGGYWQSLDKTDFAYLAPPFLDRGVAFASLNYSLAPEASIEQMVEQCRNAILALRRESGRLNIDPKRVVVCGHSAGGHLATMMALTQWHSLEPSLTAAPFRAGCSISGLYDLEPVRLSYQNEILNLDPEVSARVSPQNCLRDPALPFLCAVGADETEEFLRQQRLFVSEAEALGWPITPMECDARNHFSVIDSLADPEHDLFKAVYGLVSAAWRDWALQPWH